jgi:hypothetical protein
MARSRNELLPIGSLRENTNFVWLWIEHSDVLGGGLDSSLVYRLVTEGGNLSHVLFGIGLNSWNKISVYFILGEHISSPGLARDVWLGHLVTRDSKGFVSTHLELDLFFGTHSQACRNIIKRVYLPSPLFKFMLWLRWLRTVLDGYEECLASNYNKLVVRVV